MSQHLNKGYFWVSSLFAVGVIALVFYSFITTLGQKTDDPLVYGKFRKSPPFDRSIRAAWMDELVQSLDAKNMQGATLLAHQDILRYPLHLDIYQNQIQVGEAFTYGAEPQKAFAELSSTLATSLGMNQDALKDPDTVIVLNVFYSPEEVDFISGGVADLINSYTTVGHSGYLTYCRDKALLMPPIRWITRGMMTGYSAAITYFTALGCEKEQDIGAGGGRLIIFKTFELVQHARGQQPIRWKGTDRIVEPSEVTKPRMEAFLRESQTWLEHHLDENGKMSYYYYPSVDFDSTDNQLVRQWLASRALGEISLYFHDEHVKSLYMKNVAYNLSAYGKRVGNTMYFPLQEMAFLSTNNVAASAIATVDDAYKKYHEAYQAIINTITMQIRPDGLFDSVIKTSPTTNKASLQQDRDFAPASAMIAMGEAIENHTLEIDPDAFKPTFDFYFDYWDRSKNLYGAAWQPIGYYHMGAAVQDDDYFKAAMTVADQLVNCQNILLQIPENIGAFSKIECLSASDRSISSGVRIEAIVAAYRAAKAMGDTQRMERYRASVKLAMRHILQGQLRKDNIFYVPNIEKSLYGIRDSYANNSIRIDNVAHTVNGVYAALTYMDGLFDE